MSETPAHRPNALESPIVARCFAPDLPTASRLWRRILSIQQKHDQRQYPTASAQDNTENCTILRIGAPNAQNVILMFTSGSQTDCLLLQAMISMLTLDPSFSIPEDSALLLVHHLSPTVHFWPPKPAPQENYQHEILSAASKRLQPVQGSLDLATRSALSTNSLWDIAEDWLLRCTQLVSIDLRACLVPHGEYLLSASDSGLLANISCGAGGQKVATAIEAHFWQGYLCSETRHRSLDIHIGLQNRHDILGLHHQRDRAFLGLPENFSAQQKLYAAVREAIDQTYQHIG